MTDTPPQQVMLRVLNILLHIAHLAIILFSALGWLITTLRPLHLVLQGVILFSWFGLGAFKGWTYCFLTDLHWRVKQAMGRPAQSETYMQMLANHLLARNVDAGVVNRVTITVFFSTTLLSLLLLFRGH